jgi:glycerophosphoryl diester phosphodiesterase
MVAAKFPAAAIVDAPAMIDPAIASPASAIHIEHKLFNPDLMTRLRRAGKSVGVWTVNEAAAIKAFLDQDVDTLITDNPLAAILESK